MKLHITLSDKQESDRITAFLDQISHYGHTVEMVYGASELINPQDAASLENLPIKKHHLNFIDRVIYHDENLSVTLYERPVNKNGFVRKSR
jgi:hypothetical protein